MPVPAAAHMCPNLLCWALTARLCRAAPLLCSRPTPLTVTILTFWSPDLVVVVVTLMAACCCCCCCCCRRRRYATVHATPAGGVCSGRGEGGWACRDGGSDITGQMGSAEVRLRSSAPQEA